jgi:ABC-type Fe3+/spermidine/putrescine transport system ATPase subunit
MFECKNISISHGNRKYINALNIRINSNEVWTISAPSGKGKTTLLKYLAGFKDDFFNYTGQLYLDGVDITQTLPSKRDVAMIFQDDFLFPNMNVLENLNFTNRCDFINPINLLEENNLSYLSNKYPNQISGGELSRILLIRLILLNTSVLLLDEPFNGLDEDNKRKTINFFLNTFKKYQKKVLVITHVEDEILDKNKIINL